MMMCLPRGTLIGRFMKTAPLPSMVRAYQTAVDRDGFFNLPGYPDWVNDKIARREANFVMATTGIIGRRHWMQLSQAEMPVGGAWFGYLARRNLPLLPEINQALLRITDSGIYWHLEDKYQWNKAYPERQHYRTVHDDDKEVALSLEHMGFIMALLFAFELVLGMIAFTWEKIVVHGRKKNKKNDSRTYP